jgi:hypothetical protein
MVLVIYVVEEKFCNTFNCHALGGWNKMFHLCQLVKHNKNGVIGLETWEIYDEVHKKTDNGFSKIGSRCNKPYG